MKLRVLSANVWGLPWPIARHRSARFRRFSEHLGRHTYDLVGIQELWSGARRALSLENLRLPDLGTGDSGLALAGRLASSAVLKVEHFASAARIDRLKRKGFIRTELDLVGTRLSVVVTHLQAGRAHAKARRAQVEQLLGSLSSVLAPVILMGDFNFHAGHADDERSAMELSVAGFTDVAEALGRPVPTYGQTQYARGAPERLDRILTRPAPHQRWRPEEVEVIESREGPFSDHHAVAAKVDLLSDD